MTTSYRQLTFKDVDGLAFAAALGKFKQTNLPEKYITKTVGPLLELFQLSASGRVPQLGSWLVLNGSDSFLNALQKGLYSWFSPTKNHMGFIQAVRNGGNTDVALTAFLMKALQAGRDISGLPLRVAQQIVAAMQELENNIHEHSGAPETGILAYKATPGEFEFVVADRGMGILRSLCRCENYVNLPDEGKALEAALTDGVSRHGPNSSHGHGFRPIFIGLVNLYGELRFRSGDHAITMNGTKPELATAKISQKATLDGFFASIRCHKNPSPFV